MPNAVGLAARLLEEHARTIGSLELVPGTGGVFDVHVDDELVFTKKMLGRYPQPDDVLPLVGDRLAG